MCHQVYGRDTVFDADRLIDLLDAFETFTEASRSARGDMDLTEGELVGGVALVGLLLGCGDYQNCFVFKGELAWELAWERPGQMRQPTVVKCLHCLV